jgi:hypothetical protein
MPETRFQSAESAKLSQFGIVNLVCQAVVVFLSLVYILGSSGTKFRLKIDIKSIRVNIMSSTPILVGEFCNGNTALQQTLFYDLVLDVSRNSPRSVESFYFNQVKHKCAYIQTYMGGFD